MKRVIDLNFLNPTWYADPNSLTEAAYVFGELVFSQVMEHFPMHTFRLCVQRYLGNRKIHRFTCLDQFLCMAFGQLTYRESLRDIVACLRAQSSKLYHMGIRSAVSRNTLSNANKIRDWRIYADFAQSLIAIARKLYVDEDLGLDLTNTIYALDSTTIDLCLSVFPWARFRKTKGAVKLHTLLDLRGNIPTFIHISDGKLHDVNVLDILIPEPGAFYAMDRGYIDFERLYLLSQVPAFFVIRGKSNLAFRRLYSHPVDKSLGVICDQTIILTGIKASQGYPEKMRRVKYRNADTNKTLVLLTDNFSLPAATLENAGKSQLWIVVSVYVLVANIRKKLWLEANLYTILQVLSVTIFEKLSLLQVLTDTEKSDEQLETPKQLNLFNQYHQ
jgi:hypothetical protein